MLELIRRYCESRRIRTFRAYQRKTSAGPQTSMGDPIFFSLIDPEDGTEVTAQEDKERRNVVCSSSANGAVLSWHRVNLWVPASGAEQMEMLQRNVRAGFDDLHLQALDFADTLDFGGSLSPPPSPTRRGEEPLLVEATNEDGDVLLDSAVDEIGTDPKQTHDFEKQILSNVNGTAVKGGVTALMGPSGAGKSSLLDCLAARKPIHRLDGVIKVDGEPCTPSRMRDISGYVAQHDVLPGVLTVREHLMFHARLRCPRKMSDIERRLRVQDVIQSLDLNKCADTMIGNEFRRGLSGGEKRRVSVAEELIVEPQILFLDEPTTGLDSSTAMSIIKTIGDIAHNGTTVLLSIHQPREDIFNLFGQVVVLCEGGRVVYEGPVNAVEGYLRQTVTAGFTAIDIESSNINKRKNPADLLLDVASSTHKNELADAFEIGTFGREYHTGFGMSCAKEPFNTPVATVLSSSRAADAGDEDESEDDDIHLISDDAKPLSWRVWILVCCGLLVLEDDNSANKQDRTSYWSAEAKAPAKKMAPIWLQLQVLSERVVISAARHPMLVALQYSGALFLSICLGYIFKDLDKDLYGVQDRFGILFFIPFCLILLGMSSLPVWRDEHVLFTHEQGNKRIYGFLAYFLSVLLFDLLLVRTVPPLFFALITYEMVGLNSGCDSCLIYFALILVFTNMIASLIAMTVGAFRFSTSFKPVGAVLALLFALFSGL